MLSSDLFVVQVPVATWSPKKCVITHQYCQKFACNLSINLNTGTLCSKNAVPVYHHLFCLQLQYRQRINIKFLKKNQILLFFSIFYIKNESLIRYKRCIKVNIRVSVCLLGCNFKFTGTLILISTVTLVPVRQPQPFYFARSSCFLVLSHQYKFHS